MASDNEIKNKLHYEKKYTDFSISNILYWLKDPEKFLSAAVSTETSWFGLYQNDFKDRLEGKKVLEMGCGDCTNAAIMAAFGADVYANDIASSSGDIVKRINQGHKFQFPIKFIEGDFLENNLSSNSFDFVIGKAFLHHLSIPLEKEFLKETARLLKHNGEARFFEPAINSRVLDEIRWLIPVPGRPSKLNITAFNKWKKADPHPDRSFSSKHFREAGKELFKTTTIIPVGTLERFHRILPSKFVNKKYRRWALKNEKHLPAFLNRIFTRSQLIIYQAY